MRPRFVQLHRSSSMFICHSSAQATSVGSALCILLLLGAMNACEGQETTRQQPNIILLIADDLGYGELGCQGNSQIPTPFIDALAQSGARCTQAYVTAPNCSPSRAGLLTGRIPMRFGYEFNPIGARNEDPGTGLPSAELTLAEHLHESGYTTGLVGKWHLGGSADFHPQRHGFGEFFGFAHEGHYFVPPPWHGTTTMLRKRGLPPGSETRMFVSPFLLYSSHMGHNEPDYDANNPIVRGGQPVVEPEYLTDAFAREAIDFIDRYQSVPFFLAVTFNAVHSPLQAKNESLQRFESIDDIHRRIFAAMLSDLDTAVGRIVGAVEERELQQETLIIFLSDNGGPTKELTSSNLPLREGKGSMYEGGLRVPFIASFPGTIPAETVCEQVISSLDIMPTAARLAGAPPLATWDGQDMLPLLTGAETSADRKLFWRQGGRAALRNGKWKLVAPQRRLKDRRWELYDVQSDIGESRDLAQEYPNQLRALIAEWEEWDSEMAEPLF